MIDTFAGPFEHGIAISSIGQKSISPDRVGSFQVKRLTAHVHLCDTCPRRRADIVGDLQPRDLEESTGLSWQESDAIFQRLENLLTGEA